MNFIQNQNFLSFSAFICVICGQNSSIPIRPQSAERSLMAFDLFGGRRLLLAGARLGWFWVAAGEVARGLLEGPESPIGRIAAGHAVEALAFAREAAPATLKALAETLARPGKPDEPSALTTDWQPALAEALRDGRSPVLGVVLLTDGRQNGPGDPAATADRLSARGIPVYPVLIGSTVPPRDAAIAAVRAPEGV